MNSEDILKMVRKMIGVQDAFFIDGAVIDSIVKIESKIKGTLGIAVRNDGLQKCLDRDHVICIIKDTSFRPPPEPTVLLIGDEDLVMGLEVIPSIREKYKESQECVFVSEDFVVFPNVKCSEKECWVMPPVSFPEIEEIDGTENVASCSPSAPSDYFLRKAHDHDDDPKFASILVGFDLER